MKQFPNSTIFRYKDYRKHSKQVNNVMKSKETQSLDSYTQDTLTQLSNRFNAQKIVRANFEIIVY